MNDSVFLPFKNRPSDTRAWMKEVVDFLPGFPKLAKALTASQKKQWEVLAKRARRAPSASYWLAVDEDGFSKCLQDAAQLAKIMNDALDTFGQGYYFDPCRGICKTN